MQHSTAISRIVSALLLCLFIPTMAFADSGYKVMYDGRSLQEIKTGR